MIKSTFSRNTTKLPPSFSSKKPSLASLAQKLQGVDFNNAECTLPGDRPSNPSLLSNSFTDDGNNLSPDSGKYTRTSASVHDNEDYCSSVGRLIPENVVGVDPVICPASQLISSCGSADSTVAASQDGNESVDEYSSMHNKCGVSSSGSWNDCSLEFGKLQINPGPQKRCEFAKPTPFGRTLSAVPNPLNRVDRRQQKAALYKRFSYFRQKAADAGMRQRHYSSKTQTCVPIPFDFSTPSPDDIVRQKQKLAFGKHISTKQQ